MIYATVAEAQAAVDDWNAKCAPGQPVRYHVGGQHMPGRDSVTSGPAYVSGTSAAIGIDGLTGAIGLGLVDPISSAG